MSQPDSSFPLSHRAALARYQRSYEHGVQNGEYIPFSYPMATYGAVVLLIFFLVPPRSRWHSQYSRYLTFALATAWHVFLIRNCRSHGMMVGFGIGIVSAWGILWSAVVLVFCDAKASWQRVKKTNLQRSELTGDWERRQLSAKERQFKSTLHGLESSNFSLVPRDRWAADTQSGKQPEYHWQSYPNSPRRERLEWVLDLLTNFRGIGWSWSIGGMPSRPPEVEMALDKKGGRHVAEKDTPISKRGIVRLDNFFTLLIHNSWLFTKSYLALDALKVLINLDPYFWGHVDCDPPGHLPLLVQRSPFLLHGYRQIVSMSMIWLGLRIIFCFGPLIFVGVVGSRYLGSNGEPWMYLDHYGNYANVLSRGLAGWWGGWWHQTFRYAFETTARWVSTILSIDQKSPHGRILKLFVAFALSGILHACGSITMLGPTAPWSSSFLFFFLQPFGILAETAWRSWLKEAGLLELVPKRLGQASNFVYVHLWFSLTAPLLSNDFARGGIWLMEPVMFSPLRGLGLGGDGDGFFCWRGKLIEWHTSGNWLFSGIAL